ncbi:sirohydrochlorin chelatase [Heyndrickxia ginsengihumi]|uniref:Sirohydrochlorin chelatase n=1 Tax=Heyndrickxia ginsengihumi TaxID=363870 RepID=A0A0A6VJ14_9BACI|nr:sirohydrochlorin chelatase [Heyndrickxia ginsengihumi]KHD86614.1 hypothetical protein NG54_01970 [Heyndrickxia ginsengihumi]MBE6185274.1 sirohydrochlorin chelatase [Bacillus sp. (in: firmicutes)]MCM3022650.1 sirohydrochlorin chelatase [Heyndrickxia ginsengihumi]NEY19011.1 sirohydrochlorin chelatase [Heyndrickxia ginsengihumi]
MKNQGVLYVSHGSRIAQATAEASECIQQAQKQVDVRLQEICYLEIAKPDIAEGIERLVRRGASHIAIVPVLLLSAGHYYEDIPKAIVQAKKRFPQIIFTYGKPLGVQDRLVDILVERVIETGIFNNLSTNILLVGRGSRNPETIHDINRIAEKLQNKLQTHSIKVCFLAACKPSFDDTLKQIAEKEHAPIIVLPYLWFTGLLIKSMKKKVDSLNQEGNHVVLADYLGLHPHIVQALVERVNEAITSGFIYND